MSGDVVSPGPCQRLYVPSRDRDQIVDGYTAMTSRSMIADCPTGGVQRGRTEWKASRDLIAPGDLSVNCNNKLHKSTFFSLRHQNSDVMTILDELEHC